MAALLLLGVLGLLGAMSISTGADPEDDALESADSQRDDPLNLIGVVGVEDVLIGGDADDTISGNLDDADVLDGREGDDLLIVQSGNIATGGLGSDTFDITNGLKSTITDFDPAEDALQVLFLNAPEARAEPEALSWHITQEGVELHRSSDEEDTPREETHLVTLLGLSAIPEDTLILFTPVAG